MAFDGQSSPDGGGSAAERGERFDCGGAGGIERPRRARRARVPLKEERILDGERRAARKADERAERTRALLRERERVRHSGVTRAAPVRPTDGVVCNGDGSDERTVFEPFRRDVEGGAV